VLVLLQLYFEMPSQSDKLQWFVDSFSLQK